eukprot:Awhi_evm1s7642
MVLSFHGKCLQRIDDDSSDGSLDYLLDDSLDVLLFSSSENVSAEQVKERVSRLPMEKEFSFGENIN